MYLDIKNVHIEKRSDSYYPKNMDTSAELFSGVVNAQSLCVDKILRRGEPNQIQSAQEQPAAKEEDKQEQQTDKPPQGNL